MEYGDPLSPPAPQDPAFDPELKMWTLSRYGDVLAALREPALWPVPARKTKNLKIPDETALHALRMQVLEAFSPSRLSGWQQQIVVAAAELPSTALKDWPHDGRRQDRLPHVRPIDLVAEFADPLCLAMAEIVTGSNPADRKALLAAARTVSSAAAEPFDEDLRLRATEADAELNQYFQVIPLPMAGPTFVALSRTVACLLANGWLALLRHPVELVRLRANPDPIPRAMEEILRYACLPQSVFRYVSKPIVLCGLKVAEGDRVILRIASANRDEEQFSNPDRFDAMRRGPSHLSLGFGLHSCVGGALIRMAAGTATRAFVERFGGSGLCAAVEWQGGSGFRSPSSLRVC